MKLRIYLLVCLILISGSFAHAAYEFDPTDIGVGARPLGMGKAFVGLSDDGSAIFVNPAGLYSKDNVRLTSMAGNLMEEIPYTVIGVSFRALEGNIGIGYVGLTTSGIEGAVLVGNTPEATGEEASYNNSTLVLNYATDANRVPLLQGVQLFRDINLRVAAGLKLISEGFQGGGDAFDATGSGYDLDLASIFDITEDISGGLVMKNIIPGDNIRWKNSGNELPMVISPGVIWKLSDLNLNLGLDGELIESRGFYWHVGSEWWPVEFAALRAGIDQKPSAGKVTNNFSLGLGTRYEGFTFDYAYHTYEDVADFTTHYFSIGFIGE